MRGEEDVGQPPPLELKAQRKQTEVTFLSQNTYSVLKIISVTVKITTTKKHCSFHS